jgi:hypothetical protein
VQGASGSAAILANGLRAIGKYFPQQLTAGHGSFGRLEPHFNDVAVVERPQYSFYVNFVESLLKCVCGAIRSGPTNIRDVAGVREPDGGDDVDGHGMYLVWRWGSPKRAWGIDALAPSQAAPRWIVLLALLGVQAVGRGVRMRMTMHFNPRSALRARIELWARGGRLESSSGRSCFDRSLNPPAKSASRTNFFRVAIREGGDAA